MDALQEAIFSALGTILVALVGWVAQQTVAFLNEKGMSEKLANKKYLVDIAVQAAEQIYRNEGGAAKLEMAKNEALKAINRSGLQVTESELNVLIEASVKAMNDAVITLSLHRFQARRQSWRVTGAKVHWH